MAVYVYSQLLKAFQMPNCADMSCSPVRATAIGAILKVLDELDITALYIKLRATGGNKTRTHGPESALGTLARSGMKIGRTGMLQVTHSA
ncbi:uncharacterized protein LOC141642693 [Silene latifolia]|uniref:uncharacterized protein LOC141642693 n=1 Tax=Silene latifolia TaxID=37657 RepID=UPI003D78AD94